MSQPGKIRFRHKTNPGRLTIKSKPKYPKVPDDSEIGSESVETKVKRSIEQLGMRVDLEGTARYCGIMLRHRVIQSATDLLRLIFMYSLYDCSLREVGLWGTVTELGSLSKTAILKQLRKCRIWMGVLIVVVLAAQKIRFPRLPGIHLRLIDASTVSKPGSHQADWRLHVSFDLGQAGIDDIQLTDGHQGETLTRWQFQRGDLCLADRAYGVPRSLGILFGSLAWFVIRMGWQNLPLQTVEGQSFRVMDWLRVLSADPQASPAQTRVWVDTPQGRFPLRLVARAIPSEKAEKIRRRMTAEAKRKKRKIDERSLFAAGFVMVVSNLPHTNWSAAQILALYQVRWQIECVFKRLKSILHFDHLRSKDPQIAQVYLLAKILSALLVGEIQSRFIHQDPQRFTSQERPVSYWGFTKIIYEALRETIRGKFTIALLLKHWSKLGRYLSDEPRRRIQQFTAVRLSLGLVCGF